MTDTQTPLRDPSFMQALLDLVIPPGRDGRMPGAGSLRLEATVAADVEADDRLGPVVARGLESVRDAALARNPGGFVALSGSERLAVINGLGSKDGMLMFAIARHLYTAYYQHPRVLEALGEPARPPFPEGFEVEPTDPRLLELLQARARH